MITTLKHKVPGLQVISSTTVGGPEKRNTVNEDAHNVFIFPEWVNQMSAEAIQKLMADAYVKINPILHADEELIELVAQAKASGEELNEEVDTALARYFEDFEVLHKSIEKIELWQQTEIEPNAEGNPDNIDSEDGVLRAHHVLERVGATFSAIAVINKQVYPLNVGDCCIIHVKKDAVDQLNIEHNAFVLEQKVQAPDLFKPTPEEICEYERIKRSLQLSLSLENRIFGLYDPARTLGNFHALSQIGISAKPDIIKPCALNEEEALLLCCDGFFEGKYQSLKMGTYSMLFKEETISEYLLKGKFDIHSLVELTINETDYGLASTDNVTGIAIKLKNEQENHAPIAALVVDGMEKKMPGVNISYAAATSWLAVRIYRHALQYELKKIAHHYIALGEQETIEVLEAPVQELDLASDEVETHLLNRCDDLPSGSGQQVGCSLSQVFQDKARLANAELKQKNDEIEQSPANTVLFSVP